MDGNCDSWSQSTSGARSCRARATLAPQDDDLDAVAAQLRTVGIRVEVDHSDERMQKKIRNHTTQKVPFMLLAGAKDTEAGAVSFRYRDGSQRNGVPVAEAVDEIVAAIAARAQVTTSPVAAPTASEAPAGS